MEKPYPNLEFEMNKIGLKKKCLAELLGVRTATIYDKLNGKFPFTLDEATEIKKKYFPQKTLDYLFSKKSKVA